MLAQALEHLQRRRQLGAVEGAGAPGQVVAEQLRSQRGGAGQGLGRAVAPVAPVTEGEQRHHQQGGGAQSPLQCAAQQQQGW